MSAGTSHWDIDQTIVAIASGGRAAVRGIVRLSGPGMLDIVNAVFEPGAGVPSDRLDRHRAARHPGTVSFDIPGQTITWPATLWLWPTTRTYTGQPSAEIHLLGAPILLQKVLQACCQAGARPAGPGEFTMRAFLAGRLDLTQAEAVLEVIHAQDPEQLQAGLAQLAGGLSSPLQQCREQLVHLLAHLEAGLDFAEEDIEFISADDLKRDLSRIRTTVQNTLEQIRDREEVGRLPQVVLLGLPNAGKSSLFNALTGHPQAIVSDIRGTTRDFLRCTIHRPETSYHLVDTAGLEHRTPGTDSVTQVIPLAANQQPVSEIEELSEAASLRVVRESDIVLLCQEPGDTTPFTLWKDLIGKKRCMCLNTKADRQPRNLSANLATSQRDDGETLPELSISTWSQEGMETLHQWLDQAVNAVQQRVHETTGSMGTRAVQELESILGSLNLGIATVDAGGGEELVAAELRAAVDSLGKLVGTIYTDDLLDSIFSRFCIGK